MNSLHNRFLALTIAVASLQACSDRVPTLEAQNKELQSQVSQLQDQLEEVRSAVAEAKTDAETAKGSSDELQADVSRFTDENWREVVPAVEASSDQVDSDLADVQTKLGEIEQAADEQ